MHTNNDDISVVPLAGCRKTKLGDISNNGQNSARHDMCVIHPNECPYSYEFVNPLAINVMVDHPTCSSVASTPIGYCDVGTTVEGRHCALTKDACRSPNSFKAPSQSQSQYVNADSGCTVLQDLNYNGNDLHKGGGLTRYIGCRGGNIDADLAFDEGNTNGAVCVPSITECRELAGYGNGVTITLSDPECNCGNTRTGACFSMGDVIGGGNPEFNYFCAVSEEVCDTELGLTYQDANQLASFSEIDCRLCGARSVQDYKLAVAKTSGLSTGAIVGIAIASALGSAILVMLFYRLYFNCSQRAAAKKKAINENTTTHSVTLNNNNTNNNHDLALEENAAQYGDDGSDIKVHSATFL